MAKQISAQLLLDHTDSLHFRILNPDGFTIDHPIFGQVERAIREHYDLVPAAEQPFETFTVVTLQKKPAIANK